MVLPGPSSHELAGRIASQLDAPTLPVDVRVFSDGESKVRLGEQPPLSARDKRCVIVQSTHPPVDRNLMLLLMMAHGCRRLGAAEVIAVVPYLGYARQDKSFLPGEVVSIELVADLMQTSGISRLITVDIHSKQAESLFQIPVQAVSAVPQLASSILDMGLKNPVAVSPDTGGVARAKEFARLMQADFGALKKTRDRQTGDVSIDEKIDFDVVGRDVVLVDDMISSGHSIAKAARVLLRNRASAIYAACTHALLMDDATSRMKEAGVSEIIATNSVPNIFERVNLAPLLADAIINYPVINSSMGGRLS